LTGLNFQIDFFAVKNKDKQSRAAAMEQMRDEPVSVELLDK